MFNVKKMKVVTIFLSIVTVILFIWIGIMSYLVYKYVRTGQSSYYSNIKIHALIGLIILIICALTLGVIYVIEPNTEQVHPVE